MVQPGVTAQRFLNPVERRVELLQQELDAVKKEPKLILIDIRVVILRETAPFTDVAATQSKV